MSSETEYVCLALVIMAVAILLLRAAVQNKMRNKEQVIEVLEHFISSFECGITVAGVEYRSDADFENQVFVEKSARFGKQVKLMGLGKSDAGQHFMIETWQEIGRGYQGYKPSGLVLKKATEIDAEQFMDAHCGGSATDMVQAAVS